MAINGSQKIVFVTGKGGVGKSLIAASIASERAKLGRRVLLVELGDTSYYRDLWQLDTIHHQPTPTKYGFDVALWGGESSLREYVLHYLRMEKLYNLFFDNRVMRALVNVAPGLPEIAMLGKITSGIRNIGPELNYDDIIVDSFATGHTMTLLKTPRGMKEAIPLGPMGHHSGEIDQVLRDPSITSLVIVTLLEELPVVESLELAENLEHELGLKPHLVANKVLNLPVDESQLNSVEKSSLVEFARYLQGILRRQSEMLKRLKVNTSEVSEVPLVFSTNADQVILKSGEALRKLSMKF